MLPSVIPFVSVLWKITKKSIHGRMPSKAPALCVVMTVLYSPSVRATASGTVYFAEEIRKINGRKNAFHVQMKKNTKSTESTGILSGTTMLNNNRTLLHPSIVAASINSWVNVPKTEVNKYVPKALLSTAKIRMTDKRVLYIPTSLKK